MLKSFTLGLLTLVSVASFTFAGCTRDQGTPATTDTGMTQPAAPAGEQAAPAEAAPAEGEQPANQ